MKAPTAPISLCLSQAVWMWIRYLQVSLHMSAAKVKLQYHRPMKVTSTYNPDIPTFLLTNRTSRLPSVPSSTEVSETCCGSRLRFRGRYFSDANIIQEGFRSVLLNSGCPLKLFKNTNNYALPQKFQISCSKWGSTTTVISITPGDANVQTGLRTTALIPQ